MTGKVHRATPSFAWRITASAASLLLARYSVTGFSPSLTKPIPFLPSTKLSPTTVRRDSRLFSVAVDATGSLLKTTSFTAATSASSSSSSAPLPYDWKKQWYALTYSHYVLPSTRTAEAVPASVFDHPLVLWRDANNTLYCADDVCPHRAAALSEGRIRDGNLECLYHGWQFNGASDGKCVSIPQLAAGASIPKAACLSLKTVQEVDGIIWVYMDSDTPPFPPPKSAEEEMDKPEVKKKYIFYDFQSDLPFDHSYLVENLLDPAHVHILHDRMEGGGKREQAQALEMEVSGMESAGFRGRYRYTRTQQTSEESKDSSGNTNAWLTAIFEAPGIVRLSLNTTSVKFGSVMHCMPLGLGRSRLLFRTYFTGLPKFVMLMTRMRPRWKRHLNSCKVLEQDLAPLVSQEDHLARIANENREPKDEFVLLKTSDLFVRTYRKWLDRVGHGMPWYQGLASSSSYKSAVTNHELAPGLHRAGHRAGDVVETRYHRHVVHCPETRNALRNIVRAKRVSLGGLVASLTLFAGLLNAGSGILQKCLVPAVPIFAVAAALLHKLEQRFYFGFSRRDQLRGETGA